MTLTIENDLRGYVDDIARILSRLYSLEGYDRYYKTPTPDEVRSWFYSIDVNYDPLETAVIRTSGGEVVGFANAWAWKAYQPGYTRAVIDPGMPEPLYTEALITLLRWAGRTLAYYKRAVNPATVYAGREYSRGHEALKAILGGTLTQVDSTYLMEYRGSLRATIPPGFREELIIENPGGEAVRELAGVVNDAFSIYPDHRTWPPEEAWRYYTTQFTRSKGEFFILILKSIDTGRVAGMTEITYYTTTANRIIGYVSLLAVRRKYQRKGLGRYLLSRASRILRRIGVEALTLDSVPEARRMYEKLGFSPVLRWVKLRVPLEALLSI